MTELKTLKDLSPFNPKECNGVEGLIQKNILKQEAIKWIKEGFKEIYELEGDKENVLIIKGGIETFKTFFNITEEDLK